MIKQIEITLIDNGYVVMHHGIENAQKINLNQPPVEKPYQKVEYTKDVKDTVKKVEELLK
jgi:hypothetical protein